MTPILNGNLSIHFIRMKLEKDPFPSNLCLHILYRMDPSRPPPPGLGVVTLTSLHVTTIYVSVGWPHNVDVLVTKLLREMWDSI